MSVEESQETETPVTSKGPSELLTEARQRLGLSQKEVADKLYLTTTFIKYIDEGEFSSIPKPAFIKGYLRSYARVVELSGDEMVALYEAELQATEPTPEIKGVTEEQVGTASITGPVLQTGLIGLGGLVLVIAVIWWMVADGEEETPVVVTQPSVSQPLADETPGGDFDFALPPQEEAQLQQEPDQGAADQEIQTEAAPIQQDAMNQAEEVVNSAASPVDEGDEPMLTAAASAEDEPAVPVISDESAETVADAVKFERTTDGIRSFVTVDASGFDQLELSFSDECWVEITDSEYGLVYNDLNSANDVLTVYGTAPFKVLLGKATGVEMIYNGRPFELEPFVSTDKTAKLTVSD